MTANSFFLHSYDFTIVMHIKVFVEGVATTRSNSNDICSSFHAVFSDTYKISCIYIDMLKKSTMGNNRFNHMLVVVYPSLVPSLFNHVPETRVHYY